MTWPTVLDFAICFLSRPYAPGRPFSGLRPLGRIGKRNGVRQESCVRFDVDAAVGRSAAISGWPVTQNQSDQSEPWSQAAGQSNIRCPKPALSSSIETYAQHKYYRAIEQTISDCGRQRSQAPL